MATCAACDGPVYARGMCSKHYQHWLKTAGPEEKRPKAKSGTGTVRSDGYRQIRMEAHPLADNGGFVYQHRQVLWDKIGPGAHQCYHCSQDIAWFLDLECDHLNHDRLDNRPENLVPSCLTCNRARWNRAKTGCPHGHGPYDAAYANGWRYCKRCKADKEARRRKRIEADQQ